MKNCKALWVLILSLAICLTTSYGLSLLLSSDTLTAVQKKTSQEDKIKWVEFNVPYDVMKKAMDIDIATYEKKVHIDWVDTLAYLAAKYGGQFSMYQDSDMEDFVSDVKKGTTVASLTKDMKYFNYYSRAYGAVLNGFLGEYQIKLPDTSKEGNSGSQSSEAEGLENQSASEYKSTLSWKKAYGLKAFSPVAEGFYYSDFDDFGESRSYGYSRRHLGHDMITSTGTPVIAVESGTVEALGWNQYGGWRIGIRSFDTKRYYYYAHLQKDRPYSKGLGIGSEVTAGDVIGYTGQTGYSINENVNNIDTPHLHFGMQLIFDEDAKDSPTQIWIDMYDICRLLSAHRCTVVREEDSNEYHRKYPFMEKNTRLDEIQASVPVTNAKEVNLPVIMYHSILPNEDSTNKYVVSPDLFEKDLKYLKKKNYTTVFMKDVIRYVNGRGKLPANPVVITFDDGYFNNYYYASPILKKYDGKAVVSIIGKTADQFANTPDENVDYAHVNWDHILEMHMSGNWEIQNHSYDSHSYTERNGVSQKDGESDKAYEEYLFSDVFHLQNKIAYVTGVAPNTFTYPYGAFTSNTDVYLKNMGFKATLSCTEGVSTIKKRDTTCLYKIKRHLRPPDKSSEDFFNFLE